MLHEYTAYYELHIHAKSGRLHTETIGGKEIITFMERRHIANLLRNWRRDPGIQISRWK